MSPSQTSQILSGIALICILASGVLGAYDYVSLKGIQSFNIERREFERILGGAAGSVPIYLVTHLMAALSCTISIFATQRSWGKTGVVSGAAGSILSLISVVAASLLGIASQPASLILAILGAAGGFAGVRSASQVKGEEKRILSTRQVATAAVFAALYAAVVVATGSLLPSPTGGFTHIGDTILYVAALLFGSRVGGLVGAVGAVAADIYIAYPRWYVSIVAHGLQGIIAGSSRGRHVALQIGAMVVGGVVMALTYFVVNVFIRGVPASLISLARDVFAQAGVSLILALIISKAVSKVLPASILAKETKS